MLETLQEYAGEQLLRSGDAEATCRRHAQFFLAFAKAPAAEPEDAEVVSWLDTLERDHDNHRAALAWALENEPEAALRAATSLARFWETRGYWTEGREWLERALVRNPGVTPELRAEALVEAGYMVWHQSYQEQARDLLEEGLRLHRQTGNRRGMAYALLPLVTAIERADGPAAARPYSEESLAVARELGDRGQIAVSLSGLGKLAHSEGDHAQAIRLFEESLAIYRELGDLLEVARLLAHRGRVAQSLGDMTKALDSYEEQVTLLERLGAVPGMELSLVSLGTTTLHRAGGGPFRRDVGGRPIPDTRSRRRPGHGVATPERYGQDAVPHWPCWQRANSTATSL